MVTSIWRTALAKRIRATPVAAVADVITAHLSGGEAWFLVGPYRSWWDFSVNRPCRNVPDWRALREAPSPGAKLVLALERSIPADEPGLVELGRWSVDGDAYRLVQCEP